MIIDQEVIVTPNIKEEERLKYAKKAIAECLMKKIMESDLLDIQVSEKSDGSFGYYAGFIAYTQEEHNRIASALKRHKIKV
jgi:hypothetical protein